MPCTATSSTSTPFQQSSKLNGILARIVDQLDEPGDGDQPLPDGEPHSA
jgi:hypothetical protein